MHWIALVDCFNPRQHIPKYSTAINTATSLVANATLISLEGNFFESWSTDALFLDSAATELDCTNVYVAGLIKGGYHPLDFLVEHPILMVPLIV